jgi:hypothetical protein
MGLMNRLRRGRVYEGPVLRAALKGHRETYAYFAVGSNGKPNMRQRLEWVRDDSERGGHYEFA